MPFPFKNFPTQVYIIHFNRAIEQVSLSVQVAKFSTELLSFYDLCYSGVVASLRYAGRVEKDARRSLWKGNACPTMIEAAHTPTFDGQALHACGSLLTVEQQQASHCPSC